jgi:hypothetical protein
MTGEWLTAVELGNARVAGVLIIAVILVYWTIERIRGGSADPSLSMSSSSDAGSAVFLVSGVKAVALLALALVGLLYWPAPLVSDGQAILVGIGLVVVAHWIFEKEEREA